MIKQIEITNFKSIERMKLNLDDERIMCILGKNGTGKSTLFYAIQYFFSKLNKSYSDDKVIDSVNPYLQKCTISLTFDITDIHIKSKNNPELKHGIEKIHEYQSSVLDKPDKSDESNDRLNILKVVMTQHRDGKITWNIDRNYREKILSTVKRCFPVYFINVRDLDLQSWDKLWDIIGDLLMSVPKDNSECIDQLDEAFSGIYGDRYSKSKQRIESVFEKEKISLDRYNFLSRYKDVFKLRFGGEQFEYNERNLDYYSDGTNSFKYLKLLISLIPYVSELSCKFPIIMIDEPEIGLHSAFITELIECINENIGTKALLLFTTHSPKVIEELTNQKVQYTLYRTSEHRLHTVFTKLNLEWLKRGLHTVSIKETECYFSDYLVYVEGESEIQLFQNKYLRKLYPKLRKIHFYPACSNNQEMYNVSSEGLNLGIEYRIIVDMDKIIRLTESKTGFELKNDPLNPLYDAKQKDFDYYNFSSSIRAYCSNVLKIRIEELLNKEYEMEGRDYIDDDDFNNLIKSIKLYCSWNHTIVNWSTIEGELITYENIDVFIDFFKMKLTNFISYTDKKGIQVVKESPSKILKNYKDILKLEDKKQKAVLLLYSCNGKLEMMDRQPAEPNNDIKQSVLGEKADGWIAEWLEYYFTTYLKIDQMTQWDVKKEFSRHFPGLSNTLQELENMVQ